MKLTYTEILKSLVLGATIAFAFSGTVAHAQTDIYSSYTPANSTGVTTPPKGGGQSGDDNFNYNPPTNFGNGDWSTNTFELSSAIQSVTDPTIVFFTVIPNADLPVAPSQMSTTQDNAIFSGVSCTITTNSAAETSFIANPINESIPGNIATSYTGIQIDNNLEDVFATSFTYTGAALTGGTDYYIQLSNEQIVADDMYWYVLPTGTATGADSTDDHYGYQWNTTGGATPGKTWSQGTGTDSAPAAFEILAPLSSNSYGGSISYTPEPSPAIALLIGTVGVAGLIAFGARRKNANNAA